MNGMNITKLFSAIAKINGVNNISKQFTVAPAPAQKMRKAVQESGDFLKRINFVEKKEKTGEVIGLSSGLSASRTNVQANKPRQPRSVHTLESQTYLLQKVNFDTAIPYDELDSWIHTEPNYLALFNGKVTESKARSLLCTAFNGTHWADDTDFAANPLLQDCGIGWLQKMRNNRPAAVMGSESEPVKWGRGQEYENLDAMVFDVANTMIQKEFLNYKDMVVICNQRFLIDKYFTIVNAAGAQATEIASSEVLVSTRRLGGLQALAVSFVPDNTVLITPLSNLSIYFQKNGIRRKVKDEPEYDRIANYESDNIDYVIEELNAAALIQNITHIK